MSKIPERGKLHTRYWKPRLFRNSYTLAGEKRGTASWCIKVARAGRRETVNLGTTNSEAAATKARDFYRMLLEAGWEAALEKYKPKPKESEQKSDPPLGDLFSAANQRAVHVRPTTLRHYQGCLRQIVADIARVKRTAARHDYTKGDTSNGGNRSTPSPSPPSRPTNSGSGKRTTSRPPANRGQ